MKYVRKAPAAAPVAEAPKVEAPVPTAPITDPAIVEALRAVAEEMRRATAKPHPAPAPEAPRPTAFSCTVTERDSKGRILKFDISVKRADTDADPFEQGFRTKLQ